MMVFRVRHERPHHHQAWEWFGHGQTRALLPLNGDRASVVLTLPATEMERLLALDDDAFDQDITRRYQGRLGAMTRISERHVYPLVGSTPAVFTARASPWWATPPWACTRSPPTASIWA